MQKFTKKIVDMMKAERLYESQGGPIILSQVIKCAAALLLNSITCFIFSYLILYILYLIYINCKLFTY